jgi:hypothetical protein
MRYAIQNLAVGDCVPEAIDVETTQVIERRDNTLDDDEPPPLPPPPARGSSTYVALSDDGDANTTSRYVTPSERESLGPSFTRLIVPRRRLGSCGPDDGAARRREKSDTLVDDELLYQALLRQLRS